MAPVGDIYSGPWTQIQSDVDRHNLRENMLWQSRTTATVDFADGAFTNTSTYMVAPTAMPMMDFGEPTALLHGSQPQYPCAMDTYQWNHDLAQPMFEDNCFAFETASSNGSCAPSLLDMDHLPTSPVSPTFTALSVSLASDTRSVLLSPDVRPDDGHIQASHGSPGNGSVSGRDESDDVLDGLLKDLAPRRNGRYHCEDVEAEDHECDYAADRKCMLRKHLESTLKTNVCHHKDCKGMQFSSKAVLTRHEKEAHGMHAAHHFLCPVKSCDRHIRGFPREYNMGDHIQRVHRELDVNDYLKKSKRARKHSTSTTSSTTVSSSGRNSAATAAAAAASTVTGPSSGNGVRKLSAAAASSKARRERLEKQYRQSREQINQLIFKLPEQSTASAQKCVDQMKAELEKLESTIAVLHSASND